MKRTLIITGAYGSGKTELALALSSELAKAESVTLVDLDFVTPYFRSQDHRGELETLGVRVIAPDPAVAALDAPSLPAEAASAIIHPTGRTIVDLGGDPAGAIVMGRFAPNLTDYDMWAVVNFSRPTTPTPEIAADVLGEIAQATRLRLTGLVSNTHLGPYTTADDVLEGLAQARALGTRCGIPVVLACLPAGVPVPELPVPVLTITPRLRRPWDT